MKREIHVAVKTEEVTAPIDRVKRSGFRQGLKAMAVVIVALLCVLGVIFGWMLWTFQGFELLNQDNLTVSEENGQLIITPDAVVSHRSLYYVYQINEDDSIALYVSFGSVQDQYVDALWPKFGQSYTKWIVEPTVMVQTVEETTENIRFRGGNYTEDGAAGGDCTLDDIAKITLSAQVTEIYYAPSLNRTVAAQWSDSMSQAGSEYMEAASWNEDVPLGVTEYLIPTDAFDFGILQDAIKIN